MTNTIELSLIVTDAGTQVRAGLNKATVADYADALAAGAKFPPVIVFHDGNRYIAADGFHRIRAASRTGATHIECDVHQGGKTEALKFALGCNAHHGLRRSNADKRHAVEMAVREFPAASLPVIAKMCLVSEELVKTVSKQLTENGGLKRPETVIGLDGRERKLPPPPAQILDATGWPVPCHLIPLWHRAGEVQELLKTLSRVKGALRAAQENKDKLFAEVNFSSALSQLDQAWTDLKTAKPFAVCPTCQGQLPDKCMLCKGRGLISEHRWNTCSTLEDKALRFKAVGRKQP